MKATNLRAFRYFPQIFHSKQTCICIYTYMCVYIYICVYIYVYMYMCVYIRIYVCVYMCVYMCICICVYIWYASNNCSHFVSVAGYYIGVTVCTLFRHVTVLRSISTSVPFFCRAPFFLPGVNHISANSRYTCSCTVDRRPTCQQKGLPLRARWLTQCNTQQNLTWNGLRNRTEQIVANTE